MNNDTPLGYVYISESFGDSSIRNVDTCKRNDLFFVTFDTNLQDFDVENRNHRYYDMDNIRECIQSDKIQSMLRCGGWFGEQHCRMQTSLIAGTSLELKLPKCNNV